MKKSFLAGFREGAKRPTARYSTRTAFGIGAILGWAIMSAAAS